MELKKEKIYVSLAVSILFSFTLIMLGPSFMYFYNVLEYPFTYMNILPGISLLTVFALILLTVFLTFIKRESIHKYIVVLVFSIGLLLWLQGHFLVWNYGVLDGSQIDWSKYRIIGIIDISIWITFISFCLLKKEWVYKYTKSVSYLIVSIQIIVLAFTIFTSPEEPNWKKGSLDNSELFQFSKKENIVILLLDTFQTDIFQEILNEDPSWKDRLNGFTYYRNATGGYPTTYPSVPLILTGERYKNQEPIQDFIHKNFLNNSLPKLLSEHNYDIELYPANMKTVVLDDTLVSNYTKKDFFSLANLKNLYKFTMFRFSPHVLKKYFITNFELANSNKYVTDDDFYKRLDEVQAIEESKPRFKFYHLIGPHPPFNRLKQIVGDKKILNNREGFKIQSKASLVVVEKLLQNLKKENAYDNSMIFIIADHGRLNADYGINRGLLSASDESNNYIDDGIISGALPLILYKEIDSRGLLRISDAPVDLGDIPQTIASELKLNNNFPGKSITNILEDETRRRIFYYYDWGNHADWDKEYLPSMEQYVVDGFSWLSQNWEPTYIRYTNEGVKSYSPATYNFGQTIFFGKGLDGYSYLGSGWSRPEEKLIWSKGNEAYILIPLPSISEKSIVLDLNLSALITPKVPNQKVIISVNDKKISQWQINNPQKQNQKVTIPSSLINNSLLKIKLELPNAVSPYSLGLSSDVRVLGIALHSLSLTEINNIALGERIDLKKYLNDGWSKPENDFFWTDGKNSKLSLPINSLNTDLSFVSEINPLIIPGKTDKQRVEVVINGQILGDWEFRTTGKQEWSFKIPKELIRETSSILNIEFKVPDAISPAELGINEDRRVLGLRFYSMKLEN